MIAAETAAYAMLLKVAAALGEDLRKRLVFVGGCTTALFIIDPFTLEGVRGTDDVDVIVDLEGYASWVDLLDELRSLGFSEDLTDGVICRMLLDGIKVDFMPDDKEILGFTNRWYARGIDTALALPLTLDIDIRHLTPELFIATKLEAYRGRGGGDLLSSRDAEDILLVVDGRETLHSEIVRTSDDVRTYIAAAFAELTRDRNFDHFVEGNTRYSPGRAQIVKDRFRAISALR